MRCAVAGVRGYAQKHHAQLQRLEREGKASLAAVVIPVIGGRPDADDEQIAELRDRRIEIFDSVEQLLSASSLGVEAVFLPVGIPLHRRLAVQSLEAGLHVFCEKPLAGSVPDGQAMCETAERCHRKLCIGYQYLHTPSIRTLREIRASNRFGRLLEARTIECAPRHMAYYARNGWAGAFTVGETEIRDCPAHNASSHFLQNMLFVASGEDLVEEQPTVLWARNRRAHPIESADTQEMLIETSSGVRLMFLATHASQEPIPSVSVYRFEEADIYWNRHGELHVLHKGATDAPPALSLEVPPGAVKLSEAHSRETSEYCFDRFPEAVKNGTRIPGEAVDCLAQVSIIEQVLPDASVVESVAPDRILTVPRGPNGEPGYCIEGIEEELRRRFVEEWI